MKDQYERARPSRTRRARRSEDAAEAFEAQYPTYQYRFVEFFIDHLSDVSRAFRGDLQAMMVLGLIGQKWLSALHEARAEGLDASDLPAARTSIGASRLADITGIPRQTVRRKLAKLEARGWIRQNPDCTYCMVNTDGQTAARRDLSDIDRRALQRVARLFADLEALVSAHDPSVAAPPEAREPDTR